MYSSIYYTYDPIYFVLLIPIFILSLWAQVQVKRNFKKYSQVNNMRNMTGAQAAEAVLRANGVTDVAIRSVQGNLTDHYDPRSNTINLSQSVYNAPTIAAVGVAAHEAGHAVQYATGYGPVKLRMAILPVTQFGSQASMFLLMMGLVLYFQPALLIGILLFSLTTIFQLVTLPVEFNASRRALQAIEGRNLLGESEIVGARRVLRAAALTYVAALLMSLLQLLRYVLIFASRGGGNNRSGGRR